MSSEEGCRLARAKPVSLLRRVLFGLVGAVVTLAVAFFVFLKVPQKGNDPEVSRVSPVMIKRVLFVCVENSNRSQMAEAFARRHGGRQIEAYSAGSRPSGKVSLQAVEAMRDIGYDLSQHKSKSLADLPDTEFDVAVTMGCGDECPLVRAKRREDWTIPDPRSLPPEEFRAIRDLVEKKVKALIEELQADT